MTQSSSSAVFADASADAVVRVGAGDGPVVVAAGGTCSDSCARLKMVAASRPEAMVDRWHRTEGEEHEGRRG